MLAGRVGMAGGAGVCFEWLDLAKLLAAVAAGAVIGLERELADKPAGLRTNILICLGAALFALLSVRLAEVGAVVDRTRIAAQIVTGVGFLGAGAIIQHHNNVIGLTTAATIWAVASVGTAFGAGEFVLGILGAGLTAGVLFGLGFAEAGLARWHSVARFEVELTAPADLQMTIAGVAREHGVRWHLSALGKTADGPLGRIKARGPAADIAVFRQALLTHPAVRVLREL
ncbi:MAG: MgtC/SapB family protein [Planctomycetota bacterium]